MPVQGQVRLRKHQLSRQATFGTAVPATRAYPFRGVPSVDLAWTDQDVDAGSLVVTAAPYRGPLDATFPSEIPVMDYNTLAALVCAIFGGNVSPVGGGTSRVWTHEPDPETPEPFDPFTYQFGDDVLTDWYQFVDCIGETLEISGPDGLGPLTGTMTWRVGTANSTGSTDSPVSGTVPTPDLNIDTNAPIVFLKDGSIFIADTLAGIGAGQVTNALHNFKLTITIEVDQKRWADGTQSFDVEDYGRVSMAVELECTFSKTDDTVGTGSESDAWMSDEAVNRVIRLSFLSTRLAQTPSTFFSWILTMPMRYYTRDDGEIGGNTVVTLNAHAFFNPTDTNNFFKSVITNQLTEVDLGLAPS